MAERRASRRNDQPPKWDRFMTRRWKLRAQPRRLVGDLLELHGNFSALAASYTAEVALRPRGVRKPRGDSMFKAGLFSSVLAFALASGCFDARAQDVKIAKTDAQIDALDPGIKLFLRRKITEGNTQFTDSNVVLFLHGATG